MAEENKTTANSENKPAAENKTVNENKTGKEAAPIQKLMENIPEWVTPLLSALGSMGGSYLFFIKPLQERMDTMASHLDDLREEIKELKRQNRDLENDLEALQESQGNNLNGYLPVNKPTHQGVKRRM